MQLPGLKITRSGEGILEQELFNDRFYAYVSPENPLYERQNIRIEEIDLTLARMVSVKARMIEFLR